MRTYEFFDAATGETFFVEAETVDEAKVVAKTYFERPHFWGEVSEFYAESMGYDTYQKGKIKMKRKIRKMTNQYIKLIEEMRKLTDDMFVNGVSEYDDLDSELENMDEHLYICREILEHCLIKY